MRKTLALTLALMAAALLAGCVSPTPQEAQNAKSARTEAERLLSGFAEAMQAKDPARLSGLFAPSISPKEAAVLGAKFEGASWLRSYTGYTLDAAPVLDRVSWATWNTGHVELTVPFTNDDGGRFKNRFVLGRLREGWCIKDFTVAQPKKDESLDPPAAVMQQIRPVTQQTIRALQEGHIAEVWYSLPPDPGVRYRMPVLSFWQKLGLSEGSGPISIYDDLTILKQLPIAAWPDAAQPPNMTWLGPSAALCTYELPYAWASESGPETVRIEMTFLKRNAVCVLYMIRLHGAPFPFSE